MSDLFQHPRLKIERAKQHIDDLHTRAFTVAKSSPYSLRIENDRQTGQDFVVVEVHRVESSAGALALILGDALHNLKAALDITVNEVVFRRLHRYDEYTRFPFRKTRNELVTAINGGVIHQASKAVCDFIVEVIKPYKGGNDALWALHDLNILDKHRLLLPVLGIDVVHGIRIADDRGDQDVIDPWVIAGKRSARYQLGRSNCKITNEGQPSFLILFDNGVPRQGEPVIPSLIQFTDMVSGIIEDIEKVFIAEGR